MNKVEEASMLFSQGFNCSQSVLAVFCEELGIDKETALKISCGFGGGMRQGEVCGVVTGAFMVLGLKYGQNELNDIDAKKKTYDSVKNFSEKFKEINGSIICRQLLNCDLSVDEGMNYAKENGLFNSVCPKLIKDAITILEELLEKFKGNHL